MRWFISRHDGATNWAKSNSIPIDRFVDHLDVEEITSGDIVYGTLPVHLAHEVCKRGARYFHLVLDVAVELRGKELSEEQLKQANIRLQEFNVKAL